MRIIAIADPVDGFTPYLMIPKKILDELGWKDREECVLDIPTTHNSILIYKKEEKDV